jgi:hypothetical protein
VCVCVCAHARIRFEDYGRIVDYADDFSKNIGSPHFLVWGTKSVPSFLCPPSLKYIVKCIATEISILIFVTEFTLT